MSGHSESRKRRFDHRDVKDNSINSFITRDLSPVTTKGQHPRSSSLSSSEFSAALSDFPEFRQDNEEIPSYVPTSTNYKPYSVHLGNVSTFQFQKASDIIIKVKTSASQTSHPSQNKQKIKRYVEEKTKIILNFLWQLLSEQYLTQSERIFQRRTIKLEATPEQVTEYVTTISRLGKDYQRTLWNAILKQINKGISGLGQILLDNAEKFMATSHELNEESDYKFVNLFTQHVESMEYVTKHLVYELHMLDTLYLQKYQKEGTILLVCNNIYAEYLRISKVKEALTLNLRNIMLHALLEEYGPWDVFSTIFKNLQILAPDVYLELTESDKSVSTYEPEVINWILNNKAKNFEGKMLCKQIALLFKEVAESRPSGIKKSVVKEFHSNTMRIVLDKWTDQLLDDISNCFDLDDSDAFTILKQTFEIYAPTDSFYQFSEKISRTIEARLKELIHNIKGKEDLIIALSKLRNVLDIFVNLESTYADDKELSYCAKDMRMTINTAWKNVVSSSENDDYIVDSLAFYVDKALRDKNLSQDDLRNKIVVTKRVFRHFDNSKELFCKYYQRDLSRRLLQGRSYHKSEEQQMVEMLNDEVGKRETEHLEKMLNDIVQSQTLTEQFAGLNVKDEEIPTPITFEAKVLTESYWPTIHETGINLPPSMQNLQDKFEKFYLGQHKFRQMRWIPARSMCLIRAQFDVGIKELNVNLYQAVVLLQLNDDRESNAERRPKLTYAELQKKTGLRPEELNPALLSLSHGKVPVLLHRQEGSDGAAEDGYKLSPGDVFSVNVGLKEKAVRLNLYSYNAKQWLSRGGGNTGADAEATAELAQFKNEIRLDRKLAVQAAVVRALKGREKMSHSDLFYNVAQKTIKHGEVTYDLFKEAIEDLINNNFVERDQADSDYYRYIS